jgi:stage IV sporulation protein FB
MHSPEPRPTRWELRWRMFGADIRVHPLFWASSAVTGVRYYQHPEDGGFGVFVFWMIAVFLSLLLHEFGHVFTARLFGVRGDIVLSGLGGRMLGLGELKRCWQRLVVLLAGPLTTFLFFGVLQAITWIPFPGWREPIGMGMVILVHINFWWGLLNVLPLWPLDGGQMAAELGEALLGRRGRSLAALLSVFVAGLLTVWLVIEMRLRLDQHRFSPLYRIYVEVFVVLSVYCFVFWLSGFRALWGEAEPPPGPTA